ncbi:MAG: glycosyltransferase [Desulfobacteraceae bacterium]|nr:glycosyltransferase [Desulfobacteraceae bacterium]
MVQQKKIPTIAYFISYHGFGHATRAAAVMAAFKRLLPQVRFELFTNCPRPLFESAIGDDFGYFDLQADVGVVQRSPLEEDFEATGRKLSAWIPFDPRLIERAAQHLQRQGCQLVICEISPLGIAAARGAGVPSVLIENFTWDFIYEPYLEQVPGLEMYSYYLKNIFSQADLHIQTEPVCRPAESAIQVAPISRMPRTAPEETRTRLKVPLDAKMVVVSMGGVPDQFRFLGRLPAAIEPYIVIPSADHLYCGHERIILLPTHSEFFHPDLLLAADLLIGKAGYSTIAEVYHTGVPFGYVPRPQSPETPALERFIKDHLSAQAISAQEYTEGRWFAMLPDLLKMPRGRPTQKNGADAVARLLGERFFSLPTL